MYVKKPGRSPFHIGTPSQDAGNGLGRLRAQGAGRVPSHRLSAGRNGVGRYQGDLYLFMGITYLNPDSELDEGRQEGHIFVREMER